MSKYKWNDLQSVQPNISVFICDTDSIKNNKIHICDAHEAEHHFNWETYTPSAAAAGM
jgi:hypothetical protein